MCLYIYLYLVAVQLLSCVRLFVTPQTTQHARRPCPSLFPEVCSNSCPLSQWCHPTISSSVIPFSSCLQSFRIFSSELALCMRWPKYWSFSISVGPSDGYSGLISLGIDWFDLLAVRGTLGSLLQCQLESINSLALSLLYGPTCTSVHDYWKTREWY